MNSARALACIDNNSSLICSYRGASDETAFIYQLLLQSLGHAYEFAPISSLDLIFMILVVYSLRRGSQS